MVFVYDFESKILKNSRNKLSSQEILKIFINKQGTLKYN
jgi:hypothetical protein